MVTIVWNAAGLSRSMSGIERLAVAYTRHLTEKDPEAKQVFIAESQYEWLDHIASSVEVRLVPHLPGTVLAPRWSGRLGNAAWHSWANPLVPRLRIRRQYSFTIHDWTPFEPGTMLARHRALWQAAILLNVQEAGAVHLTTAGLLDAAPRWLVPVLERNTLLVGGDVPTLAVGQARASAGERYALAVGTMIPRKRFRETIEIWNHLPSAPVPRLLFVGRGTEELGEGPRHRGLGFVDDASLAALLASASLLVSLSDAEGLNLPAREALRAGVPVVGRCGSLGPLVGRPAVFVLDEMSWANKAAAANEMVALVRQALAVTASPQAYVGDGDALCDHLLRVATRKGGTE